jgi:hypothetical protein
MSSHHLAGVAEERREGEEFEAPIACPIALSVQK